MQINKPFLNPNVLFTMFGEGYNPLLHLFLGLYAPSIFTVFNFKWSGNHRSCEEKLHFGLSCNFLFFHTVDLPLCYFVCIFEWFSHVICNFRVFFRYDFNTGGEDRLGTHDAPVRCVEYSHATGESGLNLFTCLDPF